MGFGILGRKSIPITGGKGRRPDLSSAFSLNPAALIM
jgi:hypothetical protein